MIVLTVEEIIEAHNRLIQKTGGLNGIRDRALLESAVFNILSSFDGIEVYPSIEEKAARLMYSLVKNHSFLDDGVIIGTRLEKPSKINGFALLSPIFLSHAGWREDGAVHINTYYTESQMGLCA